MDNFNLKKMYYNKVMNTLNNKHNQFQKQHQQNDIICSNLLKKNKQLIKQFKNK